MYVPKKEFGWSRRTGWLHGDEASYNNAVAMTKEYGAKPGRTRTHDIHQSWVDYVAYFNPSDPTRSQGAFCRWAGIRPSVLSAAKRKPITDQIELKLSEWIEGFNQLRSAAEKCAVSIDELNKALNQFKNIGDEQQ